MYHFTRPLTLEKHKLKWHEKLFSIQFIVELRLPKGRKHDFIRQFPGIVYNTFKKLQSSQWQLLLKIEWSML